MSDRFAPLPEPPYFAVIFANQLRDPAPGYAEMAGEMVRLAAMQPGFIGLESSRDGDGFGLTISYWRDQASILAWRQQGEHAAARKMGRERWYEHFRLRVSRVDRAYEGP